MNSDTTLDSIREINLSYIVLVQRLLRQDRAIGMVRLGLSPGLADILADLSQAQVVRLAGTHQLLCSFRFSGHPVLSALAHTKADVTAMHDPVMPAILPVGQCA
ncbi:flagellar transcriptional regulator FlhD [Paraburkholderia sp. CNPSo 3157]|uniref:Flagellar transcriptional regulator FlhD n=1 Tax=Paraburkholderia franconis TaxID=2654983 RepID=A0A7X1NJT3_9BURK|nr:flagellar transcriptional regulator FlhD [Paraburkholderia franconis]MPW23275.1 flagellar transcriptional regulator FlhD [Paraburkholderia franconis]